MSKETNRCARSLQRLVSHLWRKEDAGWWYLVIDEQESELMLECGLWKVYVGSRGSSLKRCVGIYKTLGSAKKCGEREMANEVAHPRVSGKETKE